MKDKSLTQNFVISTHILCSFFYILYKCLTKFSYNAIIITYIYVLYMYLCEDNSKSSWKTEFRGKFIFMQKNLKPCIVSLLYIHFHELFEAPLYYVYKFLFFSHQLDLIFSCFYTIMMFILMSSIVLHSIR